MLMLFLPGSHLLKPGHGKEASKTQKPDPSQSGQARVAYIRERDPKNNIPLWSPDPPGPDGVGEY